MIDILVAAEEEEEEEENKIYFLLLLLQSFRLFEAKRNNQIKLEAWKMKSKYRLVSFWDAHGTSEQASNNLNRLDEENKKLNYM